MNKKQTFNIQHSTPEIQGADDYAGGWVLHDGNHKKFTSAIIDLSEQLPSTRDGNHVAGQILRSGTAAYLNHGEAAPAESRDDFIHKVKICLKEMREARRWARLILREQWIKGYSLLPFILREADDIPDFLFKRSHRTS